jgi:hypothetical protein
MSEPTADPSVPEPGTFAGLVQAALNAAVTPEKIDAKVTQHVEKAVDEAIAEAMRSWSDTGKTVRAALVDALRVNGLNLPSYGHAVAAIVERQIQARVSEVVSAKLAKDMEDLLTLAPKRVKLSELVAELLGGEDEDPCHCDGPPRVYCTVEWSEYASVRIYLSKEKPDRPYNSDIEIMISLPKKAGDYPRGEVPEGPIFLGKVKGSDLKKDVRFGYGTNAAKQGVEFGRWFGFEQKILAMYACGTVIEVDEGAVVTERGD